MDLEAKTGDIVVGYVEYSKPKEKRLDLIPRFSFLLGARALVAFLKSVERISRPCHCGLR